MKTTMRVIRQERMGYMKSIEISLNSIEKVKSFVNIINACSSDFDLISDRYVVDAKSIMGIFSLDLGRPVRLDIHDENEYDELFEKLKDFIE